MRCKYCARKLDDNGYCQNKKCVDYIRTQIKEQTATVESAAAALEEEKVVKATLKKLKTKKK